MRDNLILGATLQSASRHFEITWAVYVTFWEGLDELKDVADALQSFPKGKYRVTRSETLW